MSRFSSSIFSIWNGFHMLRPLSSSSSCRWYNPFVSKIWSLVPFSCKKSYYWNYMYPHQAEKIRIPLWQGATINNKSNMWNPWSLPPIWGDSEITGFETASSRSTSSIWTRMDLFPFTRQLQTKSTTQQSDLFVLNTLGHYLAADMTTSLYRLTKITHKLLQYRFDFHAQYLAV